MIHFASHFLFFILAISILHASKLDLSIQPKGVGSDQSHYLAPFGSYLSLHCELNATNVNGVSSAIVRDGLQWMRGLRLVDADSLSIFTQTEMDPGGNWVRKTLVIPQMNDHSAGTYRCAYFEHVERHAHIHLIGQINWRLKGNTIGAPLGTPLTVDCGTDGQSNVTVKIMDQLGRAIEESPILDTVGGKIYVTGHEMTIEKLKRSHRGMTIRCFAIRTLPLDDKNAEMTIHTDERNLTVEVWEAPLFAGVDRHFYKQQGAMAVLNWRVIASNPPVLNFTLKKDGKVIGDEENGRRKFSFKIDERGGTIALLNINKVNDDDYGQYTCTAHNGKLSADQHAFLDRPNPPNQPLVWPLQVTNNSVQWHVEEQTKAGQLPVSYFHIVYKAIKRRVQKQQKEESKQNLDGSLENAMAVDEEEDNGDFWQQRRRTTEAVDLQSGDEKTVASGDGDWEELKQNASEMTAIRQKNAENEYDIGGLQPFTLYEFTFVAFNEAGSSDPVTMKQETMNDWVPPPREVQNAERHNENVGVSSSSKPVATYISVGLIGFFVLSSFVIAAAYCFVDCGGNASPSSADGKCIATPAPVP
ncbi:hypothetical protein niasHT_039826 [Heterodera trifolii]|uniref:Ig-like domain-containing protein n=1 Tax=Heterodera trifolii TaxID=157864 RepID=A0ABD2IMQ1_9BILA